MLHLKVCRHFRVRYFVEFYSEKMLFQYFYFIYGRCYTSTIYCRNINYFSNIYINTQIKSVCEHIKIIFIFNLKEILV